MTAPYLPPSYSALLPTLWWQVLSWLPHTGYDSSYTHTAAVPEEEEQPVADTDTTAYHYHTWQQHTEERNTLQLLREVQHIASLHKAMQQAQRSIWQHSTHTAAAWNDTQAWLQHSSTHSHMQGSVWGGNVALNSMTDIAETANRYLNTLSANTDERVSNMQQHSSDAQQYHHATYAYMPQLSQQLQLAQPLYEYMGDTYTTALQQWAQVHTLHSAGGSYQSYAPTSHSSYSAQELDTLLHNTEHNSTQTYHTRPISIQVGKLVEQINIHQATTADSIQDMQQQVEDALLQLLSITNSLPQD